MYLSVLHHSELSMHALLSE